MCKDRVVTGRQLHNKSMYVDIEYRPGFYYCLRCDEKISIVPQLPLFGKHGSLNSSCKIKDRAYVWLKHQNSSGNINDAEKIYERHE